MNIVHLFKVVAKTFFSFLLGVIIAAFLIRNDAMVRDGIVSYLHPFVEDLFSSPILFKIDHIDFFPLQITFGDIKVRPQAGNNWSWSAKSFSVCLSWFDLLFYGTAALDISMEHVKAKSVFKDADLFLWDHICSVFEGDVFIPTFLKSVHINDANFCAKDFYTDALIDANFSMRARTIEQTLKGNVLFSASSFWVKNKKLLDAIEGTLRFDVLGRKEDPRLLLQANCNVNVLHLSEKQQCHFSGIWRYDTGIFSLKNGDRSCVLTPLKIYKVGNGLFLEVMGNIPASYFFNLLFGNEIGSTIHGYFTLNMGVDLESPFAQIRGQLRSGKIDYVNRLGVSSSIFTFARKDACWNGHFFLSAPEIKNFFGMFHWNEKDNAGHCTVSNQGAIEIPGFPSWKIESNGISAQLNIANNQLFGFYQCVANNQKINDYYKSSGNVSFDGQTIMMHGLSGDNIYKVVGDVFPTIRFRSCLFQDADENVLLSIKNNAEMENQFFGNVSFALIQQALNNVFHYSLQGEGNIDLCGTIENSVIAVDIKLVDGTIRLAHTYNFINELQARCDIDFFKRSINICDLFCRLHRGSVHCTNATILFDKSYAVSFVHFPFLFQDCLLSWQKDLFAILSGSLTLYKRADLLPILKGHVFVNRAQLKQNIFSQDFQRHIIGAPSSVFEDHDIDLNLDLNISTKEPVRVNTSFLQTSAKIDLTLGGSLFHPDVNGNISLLSGSLAFPYRPLHIAKGSIDFVSGHLADPTIEVLAKNKIKKYNIELSVSGSFEEQKILLTSTPSLTEEQIVSLLFAGSEQESLNIVVPALVMQNIKNIIFSSDQSQAGIRSAFGNLFRPFERIHLVPSFTDQTGRGGLRGAIEIDVNEQWRAMIQKNFSQKEDTRFEVEYLLSDDISFRGLRNEHGDINAEVEVRWKR